MVIRDHDNEDKLIAATRDEALLAEDIWRAIAFQEQYSQSRLILAETHDRAARRDRGTPKSPDSSKPS